MPYFESVRRYLLAEHRAGTVAIADVHLAATQFRGMISDDVFWPTLLGPGWEVSPERAVEVVDEAVKTFVARRTALTTPGEAQRGPSRPAASEGVGDVPRGSRWSVSGTMPPVRP